MLTDNAIKLLELRYLQPNETPDDMFRRVAKYIAGNDVEWEERYYKVMSNLDFLPNSPCLMNAGTDNPMMSACYVLPIEDDMVSIMDAVKHAVMINKYGGGTGFSFSRLRPAGEPLSTGGTASGPVSFMRIFDVATDVVKQGGRRKGANMGVLRVDHPDIMEFICCKDDTTKLTNFNISVGITDEFMKAVEDDTDFDLRFNGKVYKTVRAREIWDAIIEHAWATGEPGLVFLDTINKKHPVDEEIEATNPCGEQPLLPYESCCLGSINLANHVTSYAAVGVDWDKLDNTVQVAVHFLNNLIDKNMYPLPEIEQQTKKYRKIGLGVMGWADMLIKLGIPYVSDEALELAEEVMKFINVKAKEYAPNNTTRTTIAPTGSISIIAGVEGYGIEPLFALAYTKNVAGGLKVVSPLFEKALRDRNLYDSKIMEQVIKKGTANVPGVPDDLKKLFATAREIPPEWHVCMQSAFQRYVENAVSKTINMPANATKEDISEAYKLAYILDCKGITVYREGSRKDVFTVGKAEEDVFIKPAMEVANGTRIKLRTGCGTAYMMVFYDENGDIVETFINTSKGGCTVYTQATSRLISLALRAGIPIEEVIDQLHSAGVCPAYQYAKGSGKDLSPGRSCASAIAHALEELQNKHIRKTERVCPECGQALIPESGCWVCKCGYSKCS